MPEINYLEWIGYLASALVLVSLLMSSIIKLRWINLVGSIVFSTYGFMIGSLPVGISNIAISLINIYYLIRIYSAKEYFKILPIETGSEYLKYFLKYFHDDIKKYFSKEDFCVNAETVGFYIVRNMIPAGVFLASKKNEDSLLVDLDYVTPEYRDFKTGRYVFDNQKEYFINKGFKKLYSFAHSKEHENYLLKMGFVQTEEDGKKIFILSLC